MTQYDNILDETRETPRRRPLMFRLTLWAAVALCATLIVTVLLSDPLVARRVQDAADSLSVQLMHLRPDSPDSAAAEIPDQADAPAVRAMPANRIPVRRAGVVNPD